MNYDNDITRSVWDDNPTENPFNELSRTFANIGEPCDDESQVEPQPEPVQAAENVFSTGLSGNLDEAAEVSAGIDSLHVSSPGLDQDVNKLELLGSLAPEEDPLHDLTQTKLHSPEKNDPLFSGLDKSPLPFVDASMNVGRNTTEVLSPTKVGSGKLNKLFSGARVRRNAVNTDKNKSNAKVVQDPLVKSLVEREKNEQFVEESLADHTTDGRSSMEREMRAPLFSISAGGNRSFDLPSELKESLESDSDKEQVESVKFDITVVDPTKIGDITTAHVEYTVVSKSSLLGEREHRVKRRYRDFRWLYRQLQHNHWGKIIPPPPEKQAVGRFKRDFIENRRAQMERMLHYISHSPMLQKDEDFALFLTSENWAQDSRIKEQTSGSKASRDSSDVSEIYISELKLLGPEEAERVLKNGGLDAEATGGFMGLSFSSMPKYKEPDQYFIDATEKFTLLEEQLKQLYKALELVDSQRADLCSVTNEFSETVKNLAELEISNRTTDLLQKFADVHLRIKESISRSSMQDSLTLGVTIDDHLRTIGSVKAILNQRNKLGYYLLIVENDMNKKQQQLNKVSGNSANSERATPLENELNHVKNRYNQVKQQWQAIGEVIRKELNQHSLETVEDFRNNMEIYLESAIESQKECIEIWETFYQNNL